METTYNNYFYSTIKLNTIRTGESFNIGVIVMDEKKEKRVVRSIESIVKLAECIHIEKARGHDFALNKLLTSIRSDNDFSFGEFSNSIYINKPQWRASQFGLEETADLLFDELISIKPKENTRHISEYTPTKIITSYEEIAKNNGYKNIKFRKNRVSSLGKRMDAFVHNAEDEDDILIGIDVVSKEVGGFSQKSIYSAVSLAKAIEEGRIRDAILHLPPLGQKTSQEEYMEVRRIVSQDYANISVIDTADSQEFFYLINEKATRLGSPIFTDAS